MGRKAIHEEILELLPWFINESLGEKERDRVLVHLRECLECRHERDQLQTIEAFVREDDVVVDVVVPDYRFSYNKLHSRIEAAERNRESASGVEVDTGLGNWIPITGIAASLMLAVVIVGFYNPVPAPVSAPESVTGEFVTLTNLSRASGLSRRIALTFEQPIRAQTLRKALIETDSSLISGPDEKGTYLVDVIVPQGTDADDFMRSIRQIEGVAHARLVTHSSTE